ncbi:helix-turn-helix domain-containing protein [Paenibacillus hemerocallicola]|uniref:Helix-turn-helix domain-containing protein n=1 Tax=Paenibacillus hemerocallicola TaxID=1172614 RepID=A0A5C4T9C0_9BACL|nr:helix-turn-helix transcriptional regulator [Paenibacillus hemerocallicola]TNJ65693.1 helix-turn-helix domain-containing protein [Paenibacillus hemerocallicola]
MIGKRVKQLRLERGISLSELAECAGVAKSYLSKIERDIQTNPSIHFLEKIARVLRVNVEYFLFSERRDNPLRLSEEKEPLPSDWIQLIRGAIRSGVSKSSVEAFIEFQKQEMRKQKT